MRSPCGFGSQARGCVQPHRTAFSLNAPGGHNQSRPLALSPLSGCPPRPVLLSAPSPASGMACPCCNAHALPMTLTLDCEAVKTARTSHGWFWNALSYLRQRVQLGSPGGAPPLWASLVCFTQWVTAPVTQVHRAPGFPASRMPSSAILYSPYQRPSGHSGLGIPIFVFLLFLVSDVLAQGRV